MLGAQEDGVCRGRGPKFVFGEFRRSNFVEGRLWVDGDRAHQWEAFQEVSDEVLVRPADVLQEATQESHVCRTRFVSRENRLDV